MQIYEYFTGIVCGDMVQNSKPDPEIYLKACELLEANPSECYALEDSKMVCCLHIERDVSQ